MCVLTGPPGDHNAPSSLKSTVLIYVSKDKNSRQRQVSGNLSILICKRAVGNLGGVVQGLPLSFQQPISEAPSRYGTQGP